MRSQRLTGKWGIVDVQDCIQSVLQLSSPSVALIDPKRAVIRGGSAGGFTVLAAMCTASEVFAAGTSSYGVSDLRKLAEFTHKFESRYLEKLVGGTPEEVPELYKERSPVFHADQIKSPILVSRSLHRVGSRDHILIASLMPLSADSARFYRRSCPARSG